MIVVTGSTGLLGSHLLLELVRNNKPVRALIRKESRPEKILPVWKHYLDDPGFYLEKVEWVPADLTNRAEVFEALKNATMLYHCAGKISFHPADKKEMHRMNVSLPGILVDACLELGNIRLLHVSSIAAIGKSDREEFREENGWPTGPQSYYSRTKTLGELEIWRGILEGLNAVIINPSVILGPGDWKRSSARIFDTIYRGLKYYTLGQTGFVDVQDVVQVMILLMESAISGERYIVNAENLSYKALFDKIAYALKVKAPCKYADRRITSIGWRMESLKYFFTGIEPRITRQSADTSHRKQAYSSEKLIELNGFRFRPIDDSITRIAQDYLRDVSLRNRY